MVHVGGWGVLIVKSLSFSSFVESYTNDVISRIEECRFFQVVVSREIPNNFVD